MAFLTVDNVAVRGIASCVPSQFEDNKEYPLFKNKEEFQTFYESTGIRYRHIAPLDVCASDLCLAAANKIIEGLNWQRDSIDCLIFVSQTHDYILPATACILQKRLELSNDCMSFDVSLGCSGWAYGLNIISSLISNGKIKRGLLLVGDTLSRTNSRKDKSSWPLFGDAGSATAFEYDVTASQIFSLSNTDGAGADAILMPDGGYRNGFSYDSLKEFEDENGNIKCKLNGFMNGMDVFSFAITKVPKNIKKLMNEIHISDDNIDYYVFHQGNKFMDEMIVKKIKASSQKVLYSLDMYGNTSGASIPLTISHCLHDNIADKSMHILISGFGVGLSWSSSYIELKNVYCPDVLTY